MTLEELLHHWTATERHLAEVAVNYNKANKTRREIEAGYVVSGISKVKSEALFIVEHKQDREKYQTRKEKLIKAESAEKQASKTYYQARDGQNRGDQIDSQISQLVKESF